MSFSRLVSACAFGLTGVAFVALATPGFAATSAAHSTTKACSEQYQAAKSAGTLNGEKWPQFLSNCSAAMNNTAAPATTPAKAKPTAALAPANTKSITTKSTAAVSGTTAGHQTTQQICSSQYQAAKAASTLNGQKWPDFLSSCSTSIKNDKEDASAAPPEPSLAATKSAIAATRSANGKPLTAGEVAFRQRIHECSTEWQSEKQSGSLPTGAKWPQFWSQCNTKLKAQG